MTEPWPRVMIALLPFYNGVPSARILFNHIAIAQRIGFQGAVHTYQAITPARCDVASNMFAQALLDSNRYLIATIHTYCTWTQTIRTR